MKYIETVCTHMNESEDEIADYQTQIGQLEQETKFCIRYGKSLLKPEDAEENAKTCLLCIIGEPEVWLCCG